MQQLGYVFDPKPKRYISVTGRACRLRWRRSSWRLWWMRCMARSGRCCSNPVWVCRARLPPAPAPFQLAPVVDALHGAQRPVLYVGGGCLDAAPELRELVARTGVPVAQTLMGLGTFPASDPLALQARPSGSTHLCVTWGLAPSYRRLTRLRCMRTLRPTVRLQRGED